MRKRLFASVIGGWQILILSVSANNQGCDPLVKCEAMGKYKDICMRTAHNQGQYHKEQLGLPLTSAEGRFLEQRDIERAEREKARFDQEVNEK